MSASLVGSEMCIRDRPRPLHRLPQSRPAGRPRWSQSRRRACLRRPWAPVSYTHLTLPTICSV
eukprot:7314345-Alexandrium_andersonii.AAC.1